MSAREDGEDLLRRAADELAATSAQGQADVERPTGGPGRRAGADEGPDGLDAAGVDPDDVSPGPDPERPSER
ncbi:hypothetical protein [uncultured Pseudokineococcus sp.]|uniref:hypothetical protein n=1 Tax=uncultured Pseudokineococcus sp. TaxID=1642928 RepID=UPI002608FCC5|nr:hypothetical protein [uncultured Pseudokineococcus sp.]